jgi:uncharacterized membrane protein HdeD (DUF308 family)
VNTGGDDIVESFLEISDNRGRYIARGALEGLAVAMLAPVLRYLYRVVKYRREALPRAIWPLATVGPIALGLLAFAGTLHQLDMIDTVVAELPLAPVDAEELFEDEQRKGLSVTIAILGSVAALTIAAVFILISQNARKAGVLTNFIGIIGIIVGAFLVIGPLAGSFLGPIPIVQWFFLISLALLFLGRWPGGRPPAWETGEEEPWPSAQELREEREAAAMERDERRRGGRDPEREDEGEPDEEPAEPAAPAHPRSKKRKKKRKR